jgi:uncharacterized membrane protein YhfC
MKRLRDWGERCTEEERSLKVVGALGLIVGLTILIGDMCGWVSLPMMLWSVIVFGWMAYFLFSWVLEKSDEVELLQLQECNDLFEPEHTR